MEATYESTQYNLRKLACRESSSGALKRGCGCDGIENSCNTDKEVDKCSEDIFPCFVLMLGMVSAKAPITTEIIDLMYSSASKSESQPRYLDGPLSSRT